MIKKLLFGFVLLISLVSSYSYTNISTCTTIDDTFISNNGGFREFRMNDSVEYTTGDNCMILNADNIVFDCNTNSIYRSSYGGSGTAFETFTSGSNITVQNCSINNIAEALYANSADSTYDNFEINFSTIRIFASRNSTFSNFTFPAGYMNIVRCNYCTFENMYFDLSLVNYGIQIGSFGATNATFSNIFMENGLESGIIYDGNEPGGNTFFKDIIINNVTDPLKISHGSSNLIVDNLTTTNSNRSIYFDSSFGFLMDIQNISIVNSNLGNFSDVYIETSSNYNLSNISISYDSFNIETIPDPPCFPPVELGICLEIPVIGQPSQSLFPIQSSSFLIILLSILGIFFSLS